MMPDPRRAPIRRDADRRITAGGLLLSAALLALAVASAFLPADVRRGAWLPLHLALPGAATVAIGSVLPFFLAALSATRPGPPTLRVGVIALLGSGALAVSVGFGGGSAGLATLGGIAFVAGLLGLAWLLIAILGGALGPQRGLLPRAYGFAIANVTLGASLATLYVADWPPVVEAWGRLRPAHAWLNLFGFVGLVIGATLVHLYPTVVGTRIAVRRSTRLALAGLAAGPTTIALGYGLGADALVRFGAVAAVGGAACLTWSVVATHRARGRWTTDAAWHRFASWSLGAGVAWYAVGLAVAAGRAVAWGADPAGWAIEPIAVPLVVGCVLQVLVGSWTHLVPAVGPGDQRLHARQRAILATGADVRLVGLDAGVAVAAVGMAVGSAPALAAGAAVAALALSADLAVFGRAVFLRPDPSAEPAR